MSCQGVEEAKGQPKKSSWTGVKRRLQEEEGRQQDPDKKQKTGELSPAAGWHVHALYYKYSNRLLSYGPELQPFCQLDFAVASPRDVAVFIVRSTEHPDPSINSEHPVSYALFKKERAPGTRVVVSIETARGSILALHCPCQSGRGDRCVHRTYCLELRFLAGDPRPAIRSADFHIVCGVNKNRSAQVADAQIRKLRAPEPTQAREEGAGSVPVAVGTICANGGQDAQLPSEDKVEAPPIPLPVAEYDGGAVVFVAAALPAVEHRPQDEEKGRPTEASSPPEPAPAVPSSLSAPLSLSQSGTVVHLDEVSLDGGDAKEQEADAGSRAEPIAVSDEPPPLEPPVPVPNALPLALPPPLLPYRAPSPLRPQPPADPRHQHAEVLRQLTCRACGLARAAPLFLCQFSLHAHAPHIVCAACLSRNASCCHPGTPALPRGPHDAPVRAAELEARAAAVDPDGFRCPHERCAWSGKYSSFCTQHRNSCLWSPVRCPFHLEETVDGAGAATPCTWSGLADDIAAHLMDEHRVASHPVFLAKGFGAEAKDALPYLVRVPAALYVPRDPRDPTSVVSQTVLRFAARKVVVTLLDVRGDRGQLPRYAVLCETRVGENLFLNASWCAAAVISDPNWKCSLRVEVASGNATSGGACMRMSSFEPLSTLARLDSRVLMSPTRLDLGPLFLHRPRSKNAEMVQKCSISLCLPSPSPSSSSSRGPSHHLS